jgi:hypothetical protein
VKHFIIVAMLFLGNLVFAKNICYPQDQAEAIKHSGIPSDKIRFLDYSFNLSDLIRYGIKEQDISYGTKTFLSKYDASNSHFNTVCMVMSGQQFGEDSCQVCIVKW